MTFKVKEGVSINGHMLSDSNRNLTITSLTAGAGTTSSSTTTGTLVVTGGIGISENLHIGGDLAVGGAFSITGATSLNGNLIVGGDLTVNGTTTTINATTVTVNDKNIELGSVASPTDTTADGGGITLKGSTDKTIAWLNSTGRWTFNTGIEAVNIQNTPIGSTTASSGAFTTLSTSGIASIAGLLNANAGIAVDIDKFTVADATGNTVIAGTLNVTGASTFTSTAATTGSFSGQVTLSVANGTAPLIVTSSTKVANLNADLLDDFNTDTNNTASTIPVRDASRNLNFSNAVMSGTTSGTTTLQPSATASGTLTLPAATDTLVGRATTDTLTNKTINFANNTVSGTLAQFNTALSDATFATTTGNETLTNKTLTNPTINSGSGVIILPNTENPSQTAEGSIVWDNNDDVLTVGTGTGRKTLVDLDSTQTLTNKTLTSPTITGISPTITLTGDVTGTGTLTNLGNVSFVTTIAADSVALGTDTTGNYVASLVAGTGINVGAAGESATPTITNIGVTSLVAGDAIEISATTGAITVNHADTSSVANLTSDNSGSTFIQDISFTFDTFGHVTAATVATGNALTSQANDFGNVAISTDSGFTWGTANSNTTQSAEVVSDTITFVNGGGINLYTSTVAGTDAVKIEHADTSSVTDLTAAANTFISGQTYDTYGHVLTNTTGAVDFTVAANHAFQTIAVSGQNNVVADSNTDTLTIAAGTAITITTNATNDTITIAHTDTSSVANLASDNSGNTFIQDISFTFDTNGHVTAANVSTGSVSGFSTLAFSTVTVSDTDSGYTWAATGSAVADSTADTVTFVSGGGINIDADATNDAVRVTNSDRGSSQNIFKNIAVSGQGTVVADNNNDILTLIAGANITITTNATNDSITIASTGAGESSTPTLQVVTTQGATTTNAISITNTTASTSTTTGALIVSGGVGINGALNATTKSFIIPHPTKQDKLLRHGSLEGPEFGVYVRGKLKGSNVIQLPDYWINLVDPDSITVDLTPVGKHQKLYVKDIADNQVIVGNDSLFTNDVNCFYVVWAERKDVGKLEVEGDE